MNDLYDGLLEELECKICMTYMGPPIRQCETGHSICDSCHRKLPRCPLCQGKFTDSRNISLEALARKMNYPCSNVKMGCPMRLTLETREKHERECSFRGYRCAYPKCPWSGRYEDILEHWSQKKQTSKPYGNIKICHTKIQKNDSLYINIVQAYNQLFWYKFKSEAGKLYWSVQYIGNEENAKDYYFEIELFKPGQPLRRYLMSEYCQPDTYNIFQSGSCVMVASDAINHLLGDDQLLIYYMRVKEAESVPDHGEGSKKQEAHSRSSSCQRQNQKQNFKPNYPKRGNKKKADGK